MCFLTPSRVPLGSSGPTKWVKWPGRISWCGESRGQTSVPPCQGCPSLPLHREHPCSHRGDCNAIYITILLLYKVISVLYNFSLILRHFLEKIPFLMPGANPTVFLENVSLLEQRWWSNLKMKRSIFVLSHNAHIFYQWYVLYIQPLA